MNWQITGLKVKRRPKYLVAVTLMLALGLAFPLAGLAGEVCQFTQVEGQVDLLKAGQPPAIPAKVKVGAAEKDAVHTKAASRAQLHFVDDSNLTIAPRSEITIESYMYDASKAQRKAVTQVTQGMMQALVTNLQKLKEPDFIIKTPTAIMGVRGSTVNVIVSRDEQGRPVTILHVPKGIVDISSIDPTLLGVALIPSGSAVSVPAGQPPQAVTVVPEAVARRIAKLVESGVPAVLKGNVANALEVLSNLPEPAAMEGPPTTPPVIQIKPFQGQQEEPSKNR
jgi:hypothetical protein